MGLVVGIDARAAAEVPAGRGRYVRESLRALAVLPEASGVAFALYARERWEDSALDDDRFRWRLSGLPDPLWHAATAVRASREADVLLSTNSYLTAWGTWIPTVLVVFDLVAFVPGAQAQPRAARIERATIRPALRRAAALACISGAARDDLVARFPRTAAKAHVIALGADARFSVPGDPAPAAARHGLDRPYVLAAGTLEPRKNLERLIDAWGRLPSAVREAHQLALVGPSGWDAEALLAAIDARPEEIRRLGFVSDDDLAALYAGCAAFAYPSLYEGFGLPVLEAMAAGAPVLTSSVSSLPEVAGDAALLVDPADTQAIADGLLALLTDPAITRDLRERGPRAGGAVLVERCARQTLALLQASTRS